jgi:16S rRNA (cytosine967-C5)-methyltransferase
VKHPEFRLIPAADFIESLGMSSKSSPYMFLLPHETGTDGFFAAVLERVRPVE